MQDKSSQNLILLTYKGKVLLMHERVDPTDKANIAWTFIAESKDKSESHEKSLSKKVEKEIGVKIEDIKYISDSCYHARLTDNNVNEIVRTDGKLLDFFSPKELGKILLSYPTEEFITRHRSLIQ